MRRADPAGFLMLVTALVLPHVTEPDTECPDCWEAEAPWALRVRHAFGFQRGPKPRTWYDRHRERWEETGDERELVRMARHVT